ncbi:MAG: hypothetical protein M1608_17555, partial [Candidatus Omnitrophica bacterium]|nr:hypothetical protein [Candidatus Omnitrophota bacterium]
RLAAINALGVLADPKAAAVLQTFASAAKDSPERKAAESALAAVQAAQKPADELKYLRDEVLNLQKTSRELREEIQTLKKQFEAEHAVTPEQH